MRSRRIDDIGRERLGGGGAVPGRRLLAAALVALALGCGSDEGGGGGGGGGAAAVAANGGFAVNVDGKAFAIDYKTGKVEVEIVHKKANDATGYGCVTSVLMTLARTDGSCPLRLRFEPGDEAMGLVEATFDAAAEVEQGGVAIGTKVCEGFPGADAGGAIRWQLNGGAATLAMAPVGPGEANKALATLKNLTLAPKGTIKLQHKGKLFDLDLGGLQVKGTMTSTGSTAVSCGVAVGVERCAKDAAYGDAVGTHVRRPGGAYDCVDDSAYDLGEQCGRPMVLLVYDHWLANPGQNPQNFDKFGGKDVMEGLAALYGKFGKDVAFVVVIRSGDKKVVVEDIQNPGTYKVSGPAPTPEDCANIRTAYNIPSEIKVLYDKDRALNSKEKQLIGSGYTPSLLTASASGKIVAIVPGANNDPKLDVAATEAAIQKAIEAVE